jgi:hypothetical protein
MLKVLVHGLNATVYLAERPRQEGGTRMASTSKRRQTMAKMNRERALKEKREMKQERKDAKKQERLAEEFVAEGDYSAPVAEEEIEEESAEPE